MGLFVVDRKNLESRSGECSILTDDAFQGYSKATQNAYIQAAKDPESPISDELRSAVKKVSLTCLLNTVENVQELNTH